MVKALLYPFIISFLGGPYEQVLAGRGTQIKRFIGIKEEEYLDE